MPKPKIFVTRLLPDRGLRTIKERFDAEIWQDSAAPPRDVLTKKARNVDALVTLVSDRIDVEVFDSAPMLKVVAQMAVGVDNIDLAEATKRGILVTNTPYVLTETTADFAWALLIAVARKVVEADNYIRAGHWTVAWHPSMMLGRDVHGATLGIVGLGRIGAAIAKRARGFDMEILYHDVERRTECETKYGTVPVDLERLFRNADFVTLNVPLTMGTYHLVDENRLRLMKGTAYLVNNARGPVVDEKALYRALKEGWIAGAGIDVFEQEPLPADSPLLTLPNLVVAPHISSSTYETRSRMAEMVAQNLVAFFEGKTPPNLVNPEAFRARRKDEPQSATRGLN